MVTILHSACVPVITVLPRKRAVAWPLTQKPSQSCYTLHCVLPDTSEPATVGYKIITFAPLNGDLRRGEGPPGGLID